MLEFLYTIIADFLTLAISFSQHDFDNKMVLSWREAFMMLIGGPAPLRANGCTF